MASHIRGERIREARHGGILGTKKKPMTFGKIWEKYYEWAQTNHRSFRDDFLRYNKHIKESLENLTLAQISPFQLERIKSELTKQKLSPQTIRHILGLIRQIINKAIEWGDYVGPNPIRGIKFPSTAHTNRLRFLTTEEAENLLGRIRVYSEQLYQACLLALHTGMRGGEIWNLRWADVDTVTGTIHILGPSYAHGPKSGKSRMADMMPRVRALFEGMDSGKPNEYVFTDRFGEKIKCFSGSFDCAVNDLGLNEGVKDRRHKVVPHTLRHTFASWLAMAGVSLQTIMEMMGHGRIEQTQRYSHLSPNMKKQAMETLHLMLAVKREAGNGEQEDAIADAIM
jgi:integrase